MAPQFGLIGKKLGHSFSKRYFSDKFQQEGIQALYELYELPTIDAFPDLIRTHPNLKGLNVTIPYKQAVIDYLDELSPEAREVQAVNTIRVEKDGKLSGHNSDIYGFSRSLEEVMDIRQISGALILGTGGAAQAVAYALRYLLKVDAIIFASRNPRGAQQIHYDQLLSFPIDAYPLIINTTPLGMYPEVDAFPPFPYERLSKAHTAVDLIYNPIETGFMKQAAAQGATTQNGMRMLILQAEKSWEIWNRPSIE